MRAASLLAREELTHRASSIFPGTHAWWAVNGQVSSTIVPLQAKFVIESFVLEIRRNFNRTAFGVAAYSGANKFVLLFHLSEKKKRHNPDNRYIKCRVLEAALHQPYPFVSLTEARQNIRSRNIEGEPV
jgi:hypothetical protein